MSKIKCVYVAGKYTGTCHERHANINAAWRFGCEVARVGAMPVIPQANTAHMDDLQSVEWWYESTMELMRRCDAVLMIPGWMASKGACKERDEAKRLGLPVFYHTGELLDWLTGAAS